MENEPDGGKPSLYSLPPELIQYILCAIADFKTLRNAVLTCRSLYDNFIGRGSLIATRVVFNELDVYDVRRAGVTAWQATKLDTSEVNNVYGFYRAALEEDYVDHNICVTPAEAARVSRLHSAVSSLAATFAEKSLQRLRGRTKAGCTPLPSRPSIQETGRIIRSFYIMETFINLFKAGQRDDEVAFGTCAVTFFDYFAPWEFEQLASVYEFVLDKVGLVYNNMALHDVRWGAFGVSSIASNDEYRFQHYVMQGLVTLERMARARSYHEQCEVVGDAIPQSPGVHLEASMEEFTTWPVTPEEEADMLFVHGMARPEECDEIFEHSPFFVDPDDGPFTAWRWAYYTNNVHNCLWASDKTEWRAAGYVMWDRARLDAMGMLQVPFRLEMMGLGHILSAARIDSSLERRS